MKFIFASFSILMVFNLFSQNENQHLMPEQQIYSEIKHVTLSDSLNIAYLEEGKGDQTLLFIHGLGSYHKAWLKNINVLKKDYRCIALDLPGYGDSSNGNHPYDMLFFAKTVREFIELLELQNVVLVGHSMGGQIAIHTVINNSDNIQKLILFAPAGFETFSEENRAWFEAIYTPTIVKSSSEEQIVKLFEINFHHMPDDARFMIEDRLELRKTEAYNDYCNMIPQCVMGMLKQPVFEQLPKINLPTLVIYGENDSLIPNKYLNPTLSTIQVAEAGQKRILNSQLIMMPNAGHFVQWEQAEKVNIAMKNFLK